MYIAALAQLVEGNLEEAVAHLVEFFPDPVLLEVLGFDSWGVPTHFPVDDDLVISFEDRTPPREQMRMKGL